MQQELDIPAPTAMDHLRASLRERLTAPEYERLERSLHIIARNRQINAGFHRLRRQGFKVREAVMKLAQHKWCGQYLSEAWIEEIIYPRK